jgi:MFS family permease
VSQRGRVYVEWSLIALAYVFAFLQRVSPQTIVDFLTRDFHIGAVQIGIIASAYFYSYTALQFPAGVLVDRFGMRQIMLVSLLVSSAGSAIFALAPNVVTLCLGRILIALGDAVVFSCLIKFVAQRFDGRKFGLMSGLSQIAGYAGGVLATAPLAVLVGTLGWRRSFLTISVIGLINYAFCHRLLVQSTPPLHAGATSTVAQLVRQVIAKPGGWGCAFVFATYFAAVTSFSGVWGIPLLMQCYDMSRAEAGSVMLIFMIGTAVGSLVIGYISDRFRHLRFLLVLSCIARGGLFMGLSPLLVGETWSTVPSLTVILLGFVGGGTVPLLLRSMRGVYGIEAISGGSSLNATFAGLLAAIFQPILGHVLDVFGREQQGFIGARSFPPAAYDVLLAILAVTSAVGLLGVALIPKLRSEP